MAIIALANLKGGVGKSTLAVNIAGALAPKSALLDADPQATAWAEAGNLPFPVIEAALTGQNVEAWITAALDINAPYLIIDLPPMLGDAARSVCEVACDGCGKCVADAAPGAMELTGGLPVIRDAGGAGRDCTFRCPTGAIQWVEGAQFNP